MKRRSGPLGLAMLCVLLAGACDHDSNGPCPGPDNAPVKGSIKGDPSSFYMPRLELPSLTREAKLMTRDGPSRFKTTTYDLTNHDGLTKLKADIEALRQPDLYQASSQQRALSEAWRLVSRALELPPGSPEMVATLTHLNIVAEAYGSEFVQPIPDKTPVPEAAQLLEEKVATGTVRAVKDEPGDSPFWTRPKDIARKDLYKPVKGKAIDLSKTVCSFTEPKGGWGTKGGFDIACGDDEYKLKFGPETRTEPFTSRIYNALGFNVPTVEYTPSVTVAYDRRILSQFNCRREIKAYISWADMRIVRFPVHQYVNPFAFIKGAELNDGTKLTMKDLYIRLFNRPPPDWTDDKSIHDDKQPYRRELDESNYSDQDKDIKTLTWFAGSLEVKDKDADSLGAWDWNNQAWRNMREVRGAAVLSMWLGNYDLRWDNNKVKLVEYQKDKKRLTMYLSDIGAGLGDATNILRRNNDKPNEFDWQFTIGEDDRALYNGWENSIQQRLDKHHIAVVNYLPDFTNELVTAVQRDDMRWMAELIAQLTEEQIKAALIAANFQSAEVYLLTQKLLNRREHLLRDSGGGGTVRPRQDQLADHDPSQGSKPMSAKLPDGRYVYAKTEDEKPGREQPVRLRVRKGKVEEY
jgi:hypothetical protein